MNMNGKWYIGKNANAMGRPSVENLILTKKTRFAKIKKSDDFYLLQYQDGNWNSPFYQNGQLINPETNFFPEIYLECELQLDTFFPDRDQDILRAEHCNDSWILRWDRHGYLVLFHHKADRILAVSPLPIATYVNNHCRVALGISNTAYYSRNRSYVHEFFPYCRVQLFVAYSIDSPLKLLADKPLEEPELPVVPQRWNIPHNSPLRSFKAYNTVRRELWDSADDQGSTTANTDFTTCGRVFSRYNAKEKVLKIFTGPEFIRSQSYWLYCQVKGAIPEITKLRMFMSSFCGMPNMAPVFFWSKDRKIWQRVNLREPTDERNQFCPLLIAPAPDFYLSTSIPFITEERHELLSWAKEYPQIKIMEIGKSAGNIPIELLKISDWTVDVSMKKHFMFIIGQHSPQEMLGAHCMRPLLENLLKDNGLMEKMVFYFIPTVNVDAAQWGSDGVNLDGWNLNRCWDKDIQTEVKCIQDWCRKQQHGFDLFIDIHAGGTWRNHNLLWFGQGTYEKYAKKYAPNSIASQEKLFKLLAEHCGIRQSDGREFPFRGFGAKDWFLINYPQCIVLDLELSTCSNYDPRVGHTVEVSQDTLKMIGNGLKYVFAGMVM